MNLSRPVLAKPLLDLLQCPDGGGELTFNGSELRSSNSSTRYPLLNGIPWLLAHPRNSLLDWGAKLNHFQQVLLQEISQLSAEINDASGSMKLRLERLHAGKKNFLLQLTQLLEPLTKTQVASAEVYNALLDRAPTTQNLLSYEANIYRDWVWGEEENALTSELVRKVFPEKTGKLLVLGAGACRLAIDLHSQIKPELTVATDINPLFLLAVQKLIAGDKLDLVEFPLHPKLSEYVALQHTLENQIDIGDNFYLCFADAAKPSFKKHSFNTLVTPWVIDIQPYELFRFLKQINHYLPEGGAWINFGSLVFQQRRESLCYSIEEVKELANEAGFNLEQIEQHEIPYLKSPYNAGHRVENIWLWRAVKTHDVATEPNLQVLPEWILDTRRAVPVDTQYQTILAQNHFLQELFQQIDGRRSIQDIANYFAKRDGSDPNELTGMLVQYLSSLNPQ